MGICHSLNIVNSKIEGDPLDLELYNQTDFKLKEEIRDNQVEKYLIPSNQFIRLNNLQVGYKYKILKINEFSSDKKYMSVIAKNSFDEVFEFFKGSPEIICQMSNSNSKPDNFDEIL